MRVKYRESGRRFSTIINQTVGAKVIPNNCNQDETFAIDISDKIITANLIPELQDRVQMIFDEERNHIQESSSIINDMRLPIHWDDLKQKNFVILTHEPQGEIISVVVTKVDSNGRRTNNVLDGTFNIMGRRIEFFTEGVNQYGDTAEVKYLVRL